MFNIRISNENSHRGHYFCAVNYVNSMNNSETSINPNHTKTNFTQTAFNKMDFKFLPIANISFDQLQK